MLVTEAYSRRRADVPGSPLDGTVDLLPVEWQPEMDARTRADLFDAALPQADAMVTGPWLMRFPPFTPERWAKARRLKVIAGTFDNRFDGWLDVADTLQGG